MASDLDHYLQELSEIEKAFEMARVARLRARARLDAAKGRYHTELTARRTAGKILTQSDMKALEDMAINDVDYVKAAFEAYINSETDYGTTQVAWDHAEREYWESRGGRKTVFK